MLSKLVKRKLNGKEERESCSFSPLNTKQPASLPKLLNIQESMAELPPHVVPSTAAPLAVNPLPTPPSLPVQLLIAQAVSKLGTAASWQSISQLLDQSEDWPASAPKMTTNVRSFLPFLPFPPFPRGLKRFVRRYRVLSKHLST